MQKRWPGLEKSMSRIPPVIAPNIDNHVNVALHTLTNYANRLADTEIDPPVVEVSL